MKIEFSENDFYVNIELTSETLKEVSELFRFVKNAKKEPADLFLSFRTDEPVLYLSFKKVKPTVQIKSIKK